MPIASEKIPETFKYFLGSNRHTSGEMDFSVGSCSDSWRVSPSNIGASPKGSLSYSEDWRQNVPRPTRSSELQNQTDGPTSQVNPFDCPSCGSRVGFSIRGIQSGRPTACALDVQGLLCNRVALVLNSNSGLR